MTQHRPRPKDAIPQRAGVGLKACHYDDILGGKPDLGWFEIHAENYMGDGGMPHHALHKIRERYPISCHGVGLSIGSAQGLDPDHLDRLKRVVQRYEPGLVSEHLAWSTHDSGFLNDLLPVPYTEETVARVAEHIDQVQTHLGRQILLENPSTYVAFAESEMSEIAFLTMDLMFRGLQELAYRSRNRRRDRSPTGRLPKRADRGTIERPWVAIWKRRPL